MYSFSKESVSKMFDKRYDYIQVHWLAFLHI
jgi:hypothetical protein